MTSLQHAETAPAPHDAVRAVAPVRSWADFEGFYREHFRFVWRVVRRLGIDGQQVDDIVQDVFLVVHRRLGDFEGRSAAKTWLYGIVRRVVADHRRTLRRKPGHETAATPAEPDLEAMTGGEQSPQDCIEQAERVRLLHRLLGELDEDKCEVFVLAELEGLTMAEIAEVLDVNPNTIASRLRAARREFEAALERETRADDAIAHGAEEQRRSP